MSKSFRKGYMQVQNQHIVEVREKITKALGLNNRQSFYNRMDGKPEPKVSEAKAIEDIFAEYNITDIWGDN